MSTLWRREVDKARINQNAMSLLKQSRSKNCDTLFDEDKVENIFKKKKKSVEKRDIEVEVKMLDKGDARVKLGIGKCAFVCLSFCLLFKVEMLVKLWIGRCAGNSF